jgi:hypothetical protein
MVPPLLTGQPTHHVGRNGKAMSCEPPDREKIAVKMPTMCVTVHQWTAGIARIDRRIGLDEKLIVGNAYGGARRTAPCVTVCPTPNGLPSPVLDRRLANRRNYRVR